MVSIGRALTDFVYPPFCILCEARDQPTENNICQRCWDNLPRANPVCLEPSAFQKSLQKKVFFDKSVAVWQYSDPAQEIIHLLKYDSHRRLSENLGRAMGNVALKLTEYAQADCILPVPLHSIKHREREFNQSLLLARYVSEVIKVLVNSKALVRIRQTNPQANLTAEERRYNVEDAFAVSAKAFVDGAVVIIIDDVITTGSTINECAKELKKAGAKQVLALTAVRA